MKIGELKTINLENGDFYYQGKITTLKLSAPIELYQNGNRRGDNSPDYQIMMKSPYHGDMCSIGSGWNKVTDAGQPYISLSLELPEIYDEPLSAACFEEHGGFFNVVLSRKKQPMQPQLQEAA